MLGPEMNGHAALAEHYDGEAMRTLELARFAHEAGLKGPAGELMTTASQQTKTAEKARQRDKLQMILTALAAKAGPVAGSDEGILQWMMENGPEMPGMGSQAPAGVPGYAYGTTYHPGGLAVVGEQGPEMLNMPQGSQVMPNPQTQTSWTHGPSWTQPRQGFPYFAQPAPGWAPRTDIPAGNPNFQVPLDAPLGPGGQFSGPQFLQMLQRLGVGAGAFDPLGSEKAAALERDAILGGMGARQAQAAKVADIYAAGDPSFRAYSRSRAAADTQSEGAQAYREARARNAQQALDFIRQIYMSQLGGITRKDPKQPNALAEIGGQVGGAAIGALLSGGGGTLLGGGGGGGGTPGPGTYFPPPMSLRSLAG